MQINNQSDVKVISIMELKELVSNLEDGKILVIEWEEEDEL